MSQSCHMKAITSLSTDHKVSNGPIVWAFYKLGMYSTVLQYAWDGRHIKGGIAKVVSLAACGQTSEAELILTQLLKLHGLNQHKLCLSMALAPFMPTLALSLLREVKHPPKLLLISLLLKNNLKKESEQKIKLFLKKNNSRFIKKNSEIYLFASNVIAQTSDEQLKYFNLFLESHDLPLVNLSNPLLNLGVLNLECIHCVSKKNGPLVSILMTAHNIADRIAVAVESILKQSYRQIELIIINDASNDDTEQIILDLMKRDQRIRYIALTENVGTFAAKTIGFQHAKGDFVMCHDSDDWSHPLRIERQVEPLLLDPSIVATTSNWIRLQDDGIFYTRSVYPLTRLNPSSALFRRQLVAEKAGLWDLVRTGADSEFNARLELVFGSDAIQRVKLPLALGAHRQNSLMTASDTGHTENKMSIVRLAYWEAWSNWHIQMLKSSKKPYLPNLSLMVERPFDIPIELYVSLDSLQTVISQVSIKADRNG